MTTTRKSRRTSPKEPKRSRLKGETKKLTQRERERGGYEEGKRAREDDKEQTISLSVALSVEYV